MKILSLLLIFTFSVSGIITADAILVGDGKKESDVILVGTVISSEENKVELETNYVVQVENYLKTPKNYDTNAKTVTVTSPGLRQYDDPQKEVVYSKMFNVGDRVLFLLYQKEGKLRESLWSITTKSSCTPKQLLDEMYGPSGLSISQNNQSKYLYTNKSVDITFHIYNRDLLSEKKDLEFQVFTPNGKLSEKRQVQLQECKRSAEVKWSFIPTVQGKYTFSAALGPDSAGSESYSGISIMDYVDSPLKQFKSGILIDEIQCKEGLQLVIKSSNGNPACVTSHTKGTLIQRGWTESQDSFASKILTELRSGSQPITAEQGEFVKKIALMDSIIQEFVKDKTWDFDCCSYLTSNSEPKNLDVVITFFDYDSKKQLEAVMDLQEVRVVKTQIYDTVHLDELSNK